MTPEEVEARAKRALSVLFTGYGHSVNAVFLRFQADHNRSVYDLEMAEARRAYLVAWEKIEARYHAEMADAA